MQSASDFFRPSRPRAGSRRLVEEVVCIDLIMLKPIFKPNHKGACSLRFFWKSKSSVICVQPDLLNDQIWLRYLSTDAKAPRPIRFCYPVSITYTKTQFNGRRPWFLCPNEVDGKVCGRRVRTLFPDNGHGFFVCRQCALLQYETKRFSGNEGTRAIARIAWLKTIGDRQFDAGNFDAYRKTIGRARDFVDHAEARGDRRRVRVELHPVKQEEFDAWHRVKGNIISPGRYETMPDGKPLNGIVSHETLCATVDLLAKMVNNLARWNPGIFDGISPATPEVSRVLRLVGMDWEAISGKPSRPKREDIEPLGKDTTRDGSWRPSG